MNDEKKEAILWWIMMLVLACLIFVLQYKDTPRWTDAIKPLLAICVLILLARAVVEFYYVVVGRCRLNIWSLIGFSASIVCLLFLWFTGSPIKALLANVGMALGLAVIVLMVNWIKGRK